MFGSTFAPVGRGPGGVKSSIRTKAPAARLALSLSTAFGLVYKVLTRRLRPARLGACLTSPGGIASARRISASPSQCDLAGGYDREIAFDPLDCDEIRALNREAQRLDLLPHSQEREIQWWQDVLLQSTVWLMFPFWSWPQPADVLCRKCGRTQTLAKLTWLCYARSKNSANWRPNPYSAGS
jgi:hypothetical protein